MDREQVWLSKKISYVLRHNPCDINIELDEQGWVDLDHLVDRLRSVGGVDVDRLDVLEVVLENDKQRFQLVDNPIRATPGSR